MMTNIEQGNLFISNHPPCFWYEIPKIAKEFDCHVVAAEVFCGSLERMGIGYIGVATESLPKVGAEVWRRCVTYGSRLVLPQVQDKGLSGRSLVQKVVSRLGSGRNLIFSPEASTLSRGKWQGGIGLIAKELVRTGMDNTGCVFVNIPMFGGGYRVHHSGTVNQMIGEQIQSLRAGEIAQIIEQKYRNCFM